MHCDNDPVRCAPAKQINERLFMKFVSLPRLSLVLCPALLLPLSTGYGQREAFYEPWRWASYTVASGLPSNQVLCIAEAPSGTIWAGTQKGLAWFDNYSWHAIDASAGIPTEPISLIEPLSADSILVVTEGGLYAGTSKGFTLLIPSKGPEGRIQSVVATSGGDVYVLSVLALYAYKSGGLFRIPTPAARMQSGGSNFWKTSSGKLWLNTVRGLYRGDGKSWTRVLPSPPTACFVTSVVEDRFGNGLAAIDQPNSMTGVWEWKRFGPASLSSTERSRFPQTMDVSSDGTGIVVYQSGDVRIRHNGVWSSETAPPLAFASTHVVKYRKNGDLWVGTDEGLFLFRTLSNRWEYWRHPFADLRNYAHEICRTKDGSIWVGTLRGVEIHRPNGRVENFDEILGTTLGTVTGIAQDQENNVWISSGSTFQGVFRWDGHTWKHFGPAEGLLADHVHKIRSDRRGRLWFLGLGIDYRDVASQPGAFVLDRGTFISWPRRDSLHDGLVSGRVYCFAEGKDGAFWFGTLGGLSRWKAGHWSHWTQSKGLLGKNERIYALAIDSSETVWFSNHGSGLGMIDKSDSVRFYTTDNGLVNNTIWDLRVDPAGALWISTQGGLSCYDKGIWSNVTLRNGLNSLSLWDLLPLKEKVYVGTRGSGVNILNRLEQMHPPLIRFSKPSVQGTTALVRWKTQPYFGQMEPEDIVYRYRVDGTGWSNWGKETEVSLSNLEAGEHAVEIQCRGLLGVLSDPVATPPIVVEQPLYRRLEVLIPISILACTLAFLSGAYWRRESKYKRQLEQSDERFRLIASFTSDAIYDWNLATHTAWANDPGKALLNGSAPNPERSFSAWLDTIHEEDRERVRANVLSILERKIPDWKEEFRYLRKDGSYGHILHRALILYDDAGNPVRLIGSGMDISDRKDAEELTRNLSRRILEAQEGERRRVSRELHDSVNQILASVKFRIESLEEQLPGRNLRVKREARKSRQLLNKVMSEVRRISRNLRPSELDDLGLASAVRTLAEEFTERTKIVVTIKGMGPERNLPPEIAETLYRIIQEALTNVEKHSRATRVTIRCASTYDEIVCSLSDNGRGIHPDDRGKTRTKNGGLGLVDMRERLSFLKGRLEITSRGKRGTTVTVRIPLAPYHTTKTTQS